MQSLMSDGKWDELRLAMHGLGRLSPLWRIKDVDAGYLSPWDGEWYYDFSEGGYQSVEWVEMKVSSEEQRRAVLAELQRMHVPGHVTEEGFKVYGYAPEDQRIDSF